jgi:hypothetical protein
MKPRQKFNSLCKKCKKPLIRFRIGDNVQTTNGELKGEVINYEITDMIELRQTGGHVPRLALESPKL